MFRSLVSSVALSIALLSAPLVAHGDEAKEANCDATTAIIAEAVAQRANGTPRDSAVEYLLSDEAGVDDKYDQTVPLLVDWVYSIDEGDLAGDVPGVFRQSCMGYDG